MCEQRPFVLLGLARFEADSRRVDGKEDVGVRPELLDDGGLYLDRG